MDDLALLGALRTALAARGPLPEAFRQAEVRLREAVSREQLFPTAENRAARRAMRTALDALSRALLGQPLAALEAAEAGRRERMVPTVHPHLLLQSTLQTGVDEARLSSLARRLEVTLPLANHKTQVAALLAAAEEANQLPALRALLDVPRPDLPPFHLVISFQGGQDGPLTLQVVEAPTSGSFAERISRRRFPRPLPRGSDLLGPGGAVRTGQKLYRLLLHGVVGEAFAATYAQAREEGRQVLLHLRFARDAIHLAQMPWEALHDGDDFLISRRLEVVRDIGYAASRPAHQPATPRRMLVVAANPSDSAPINTTPVVDALQALPDYAVEVLTPPTFDALLQRFDPGQPPIDYFHFEGHGDFGPFGGVLAFEDEQGQGVAIRVDDLLAAFGVYQPALAFLNACRGAQVGGGTLFASMAPALIAQGATAAVGMQAPIDDRAAVQFATTFYMSLSQGYPLSIALSEARRQLLQDAWAVPALYLRPSTLDALPL